ncbi:MAG: Mut7-C RNAse domain-containing protein [Chloroflexota bacterium]
MKFIADNNVGQLDRWLRMMGYDTLFFDGSDDRDMVEAALTEDRIILTRDTQLMKRGLIASGRVKAVLIKSDRPELQMRQIMEELDVDTSFKPFTLCLECNQPLEEKTREQVKELIPPYVYKTQNQYRQCPRCHRIYWRGTHWQAMTETLKKFNKD